MSQPQSLKTHNLRVLLTNAFGLLTKLGELQHCVTKDNPDVVIVTETKFTLQKVPTLMACLAGYHEPLRLDRTSHGGGVAVWVRHDLAFQHLDHIKTYDHEVIWFSLVARDGHKIVFCAAYRSGSCSESDLSLWEYLDSTLEQARSHGRNIVIAGDFNIHNKSWLGSTKTTRVGEFAEEVCASHGVSQHVSMPTRGNNPLDLILTDFPEGVSTRVMPPLGLSDHAVVIADVNLRMFRETRTTRVVWRYAKADWSRLKHYYNSTDWTSLMVKDPDEACQRITEHILAGMSQFIPSMKLTTRPNDPIWWTPECTLAVKSKEKAWKRYRKLPCEERLGVYRQSVKEAAEILRSTRRTHMADIRTRLTRGDMNDKAWWSTVKQASGEGGGNSVPLLTDMTGNEFVSNREKADCLAGYFSQKCSLKDDFTGNTFPPMTHTATSKLCTVRFRPSAVTRALRKLDVSKATGPDGIPARVLKHCANELGLPLSQLFTHCFTSGVQPALWKTARVVPIHKRRSKSAPSNYRPVSLLCIISKVMESIVNRSLMNHLETNGILSKRQYGFRRGLGTSDLLSLVQHEWASTLAHGGEVHAMALDIAGAFDKVSHSGVLFKAERYGITGQLLSWITSYLQKRQLQVVVSGQCSTLQPITAGVPQGSILGPTLFLIYVNDCEQCIPPSVHLAVYADDTTVYTCVPDKDSIASSHAELQSAVNAISQWGKSWKIQFEPTKSQAMTISHHRPPWRHPTLSFDGTMVREESALKLLGVTIDSTLGYADHLRNVAVRASQRMYFLRRVAPLLNALGRAKLFKGFVRPLFEYCPLVWMGASTTALSRLDNIQRRALKLINPESWLPSLNIRRAVSGLCYIYKLLSLPDGSPLVSLLPSRAVPRDSGHNTRRKSSQLDKHCYQLASDVPFTARNSILRSFPTAILPMWNSLPATLLQDPPCLKCLQGFKVKVYRHLLRADWEWATTRL